MEKNTESTIKTINIKPTWTGVLRMLLAAWTDGSPEGKRIAFEELHKLAAIADKYVELAEKGESNE